VVLAAGRLRVHPAKPKIGLRTTRADEMWHIDTTVIRLLDGTGAVLNGVSVLPAFMNSAVRTASADSSRVRGLVRGVESEDAAPSIGCSVARA
jgi:hypothetical protein